MRIPPFKCNCWIYAEKKLGSGMVYMTEYIVFNITDFAFMYTIPLPSFFSAYIQQLHLNGGILIYSLFAFNSWSIDMHQE
jgi:hypothetical protein